MHSALARWFSGTLPQRMAWLPQRASAHACTFARGGTNQIRRSEHCDAELFSGHCFDIDKTTAGCQRSGSCDTLFVFDYTDTSATTSTKLVFPAKDVYDCASLYLCDVRSGMSLPVYDFGEHPAAPTTDCGCCDPLSVVFSAC